MMKTWVFRHGETESDILFQKYFNRNSTFTVGYCRLLQPTDNGVGKLQIEHLTCGCIRGNIFGTA